MQLASALVDYWYVRGHLSEGIEYFQKDYEQMEAYAYQTLRVSLEIWIVLETIFSLRLIGIAKLKKGDYPEAIKRLIESLEWAHDRGDEYGLLTGVMWLARTAAEMGESNRAARLLGATDAHLQNFFKGLNPWDQEEYESHVAQVHSLLDQADIIAAWAEGQALTLEQAVEEAKAFGKEFGEFPD